MGLGNTLNILRPPGVATMPVQTGWNEDLVKNLHNVLGEMSQQISATGTVSTASLTSFDTKAVLEAATVPLVVDALQLTGYTTAGDGGGALYKRVVAEPSHALKIQSLDGAWWEIVPDLAGLGVKQAGCKVDGTTDDTTAFQGAAKYAADKGIALIFPTGVCLLKDGIASQAIYDNVTWVGEGRLTEGNTGIDGSRIKFAPTATTKYLFEFTKRGRLEIRDITIEGIDPVDGGELKLFRFTAGGGSFAFTEVDFEGSHHWSLYFEVGSYSQNASLTNVQFRRCGTIGSASSASKGTLLNLNNVNHESTVPANTEKVVMDLRGWRVIAGTNVLLEGVLPSADDWIILRLDNGAAVAGLDIERGCSFNGFWTEWSNDPLYSVSVTGSMCKFTMSRGLFNENFSMYLDKGAIVTIDSSRYTATDSLNYNSGVAVFGDVYSKVLFYNCKLRNLRSTRNVQISYVHCQNVTNNVDFDVNYELTTIDNEVIFEWNGGLLNPNSIVTHPAVSDTLHLRTIVTDAVYGRIINITKNGGAYPRWWAFVEVPAEWANMTLTLQMYAHVPTVSGETSNQLRVSGYFATFSETIAGDGTYKWYQMRVKLPSGAGGSLTFESLSDASSSTTDFKIAALRISLGDADGRFPRIVKPINVRSFATAAPTTGTWLKGDIVDNSAPAAGGTMGFVCTTAGTPGTWKTFGAVAA